MTLRYRMAMGFLVAAVFSGVFAAAHVVLGELGGPPDDILFCFVGSLVWTALLVPRPGAKWLSCLVRAVPIVALVWWSVGLGTEFKGVVRGGPSEWAELFRNTFWVTVITGWWLIPAASFVLWAGSRVFRSLGRAGSQADTVGGKPAE